MSFSNLKPYFVKKQKDFNTCCKYHQIMIEIKVGFCNMLALIICNGDVLGVLVVAKLFATFCALPLWAEEVSTIKLTNTLPKKT